MTPKGTMLPFLDLRGKPYLQVAHRLVWFREDHPTWTIRTAVTYDLKERFAIGHATILDEAGRTIATAHKYEDAKGFGDYIEKSETGAIGRALALCGYGTQFAPEFDEEDRIVDSPVARAQPAPAYAKFVEWARREQLDPTDVRAKVKAMFGKETSADLTSEELSKLVLALRGDFNESFDESGTPLPGHK